MTQHPSANPRNTRRTTPLLLPLSLLHLLSPFSPLNRPKTRLPHLLHANSSNLGNIRIRPQLSPLSPSPRFTSPISPP
ncbi:hypothetical protein M011DRAFT_471408 [Sporormia fimetaria CBS 119925]|uniref:REJ domain-containing protein n=1 Tax=Sporormia fimetaria CBS 119925 TaxID=1340428 RepID=A0A6A6V2G1_9PLEO|nr:hypothetical protein M011DRAFT_471408 [Sporormia fimetaria CBS 119925]